MRKDEMFVGAVYAVMVSGSLSPVLVTGEAGKPRAFAVQRFRGVNMRTGREVAPFTGARAQFRMCAAQQDRKICVRTRHGDGGEHKWLDLARSVADVPPAPAEGPAAPQPRRDEFGLADLPKPGEAKR